MLTGEDVKSDANVFGECPPFGGEEEAAGAEGTRAEVLEPEDARCDEGGLRLTVVGDEDVVGLADRLRDEDDEAGLADRLEDEGEAGGEELLIADAFSASARIAASMSWAVAALFASVILAFDLV